MKALQNCGKLEVRESPIEGFGVFATDKINAGEVLEEVPFILFPRYVSLTRDLFELLKNTKWISDKEIYMENLRGNLKFKEPEKYYFKWHPPVSLDGDSMWTVLPLGFGPIYNTSNTNNNADWKIQPNTFIFRAEKDIDMDEEICTFYGYFLGEDGTSFPCESVFHFAIDMFPGIDNVLAHKIKMLRFGTIDAFNAQKQNPSAHKMHTLIQQSADGLSLKKITLLQANMTSIGGFEFAPDVRLTAIYRKLVEANNHPAPIIEFQFEYTDKESASIKQAGIVWKKR